MPTLEGIVGRCPSERPAQQSRDSEGMARMLGLMLRASLSPRAFGSGVR